MAPLSTRVTATLANASEHHSIFGQYAQTPIYHTPVTVEAVPDEKGCLAVELPFTEAKCSRSAPSARSSSSWNRATSCTLTRICSTCPNLSTFPAKARPTISSSPPCGPAFQITYASTTKTWRSIPFVKQSTSGAWK